MARSAQESYFLTELPHFRTHALPADKFSTWLPRIYECYQNSHDCKSDLELLQLSILKALDALHMSRDVHALYATGMDKILAALMNHFGFEAQTTSLLAIGGYGRSELSLHSDVDLMIITEKTDPAFAEKIKNLNTVLWDAGLDVALAVRSLKQCNEDMKADHTIFTSLIENHFIWGSETLYGNFKKNLQELLNNKKRVHDFIENKLSEFHERTKKFGDSVFLLQPNLKDGTGGLRDIHLIRWIARAQKKPSDFESWQNLGFISESEHAALDFSLRFLLQVRNRLHFFKKKKTDQLLFDVQEPIAKILGFEDHTPLTAAEAFMQTYYTIVEQVKIITATVLRHLLSEAKILKSKNKLSLTAGTYEDTDDGLLLNHVPDPSTHPEMFMNLFYDVSTSGKPLHPETRDVIREYSQKLDDTFREHPGVNKIFRKIAGDLKNFGLVLFQMHDTRVFDAFIPEFRKLRHHVQRDIYHVYTVDTHSIFAVNDLSRLACGKYAQEFSVYEKALNEVKNPALLSLGLLFHDVGKGEGGNHSIVGADMARGALRRMGFSENDIEAVAFLVLSHLMMPHLSQRRDLEEDHLIAEFAKTVGSLDHLNMLTVLTWADIRAVSRESWTEWKGALLTKLYEKTRHHLLSSEHSNLVMRRRSAEIRRDLITRFHGGDEDLLLESFLSTVSPRYLFAHDLDQIREHYRLIRQHQNEPLVFSIHESQPGASEILILTANHPRVLALVTGVMLAFGINILDMEIFTLLHGSVFITLSATSETGQRLSATNLTGKIGNALRDVFSGKTFVEALIAKRKKPSYLSSNKAPLKNAETRIDIDNDVSPYFTVIDVYTHDRLGLLYDIIRTLTDMGCYVEVSKISTKVEQVVDSFYVKDIFGHKILSKDKLKEIRSVLESINP